MNELLRIRTTKIIKPRFYTSLSTVYIRLVVESCGGGGGGRYDYIKKMILVQRHESSGRKDDLRQAGGTVT